MKKLELLIAELESKIPHSDKINLSVSSAPVGWHIEHTLMASLQIIGAVKKSNPADYEWKFNLSKIFVFTLNKIPRGKAKAPKSVMPVNEINKDNLIKDTMALKEKIKELTGLHPNSFFVHPFFGKLNLKATIRMLRIHTQHHISIIDDIIHAGQHN
jgi:hypothetical protein